MEPPPAREHKSGYHGFKLDISEKNVQNKVKFQKRLHSSACNVRAKFRFNCVKFYADFLYSSIWAAGFKSLVGSGFMPYKCAEGTV